MFGKVQQMHIGFKCLRESHVARRHEFFEGLARMLNPQIATNGGL